MHMSIVGFLQDSTSCGQLPLLLSVVLCAPQSSREEYKLYKQPLQKIICIKSLSGLKIASSSVSWTLQGWQKYWDCEAMDGGLWSSAPGQVRVCGSWTQLLSQELIGVHLEVTTQGRSKVSRRDLWAVFDSVPGTGIARTVRAKT